MAHELTERYDPSRDEDRDDAQDLVT